MITDVLVAIDRYWADADRAQRWYLVWTLANDVVALGLIVGCFLLLFVGLSASLSTVWWVLAAGVGALWLLSVVAIDPVADRYVSDIEPTDASGIPHAYAR
ncbi:hypothetical protein [Natronomonas sp. EA1]|uniref:hypothetical protein n=1 Tax=Natronomonas sp. EA1 TaxID=3421655 RepID=UPI003EBA1467